MKNKLLLAIMLASMVGGVQAVPTPLGTVGAGGLTHFGELPYDGAFSDQYTFTLGTGNALEIGFASFFWGSSSANIPLLNFELLGFGNHSPLVSLSDDELTVSTSLSFSGLSAGHSYTLLISGPEADYIGPDYSLHLVAITNRSNQVPEPESLGLLLGALGLMGLAAKRRAKTTGV